MGIFEKLLGVKDHEGNRIEAPQLKQFYKNTLAIAWPSTVEGALMSIIGSVDTMMVGTLGAASIAAVGLTGQPRMILLLLAQALCVGTTALCARRKGAHDHAGANACLNQSLAIITVIGILMATPMLHAISTPADVMEGALTYLRIYFGGIMFLMLYNMCSAILRAVGDSRRPVLFPSTFKDASMDSGPAL